MTILLTLSLGLSVEAQTLIGVRGQAANTWMINKNLSDNGDFIDYKGTFSGGYGITAIHYIGESAGIEVGLGFNTIAQQTQGEYEGLGDTKYNYIAESSVKYLEIPVLFKALSAGGSYFEFGPVFALHQSEEEKIVSSDAFTAADMAQLGIASTSISAHVMNQNKRGDDFNSFQLFGIIGFGVNFDVAENVKMGVGLRLGYSFADALNEFSESELNNDETDLGWFSSIAHTDAQYQSGEYSYEKSNAAFAALNIGLYYAFE